MGCEDYVFEGLLPGISTSLETSVMAAAQGCSTFGFAYIASIPLCAVLLSRRPARDVLIMALVLFLMGNLGTLLSTHFFVYIGSRFVAGLGSGLFLPVAVAAAIQKVEPRFHGRALSLMWGANSVGAVLGVPMGLWIADQMGWRATIILFLILASFALVGILLQKQTFRVATPPPSLGDQLRLLKDRRVLAVIGVTLLTATGCLGLYSYISQVLAGTDNSSDLAFSLWSLGGLMGSVGIGHILDRVGQPQRVMVFILAILLTAITAIPTLGGVPTLGLLPFLIWGAMGWASVTPQQYSLIKLKEGHEAILVALNSSAVSLGGAFGTVLGGMALSRGVAAGTLPYVTSVFVLCALICQIRLAQTK
jgi:predicted MFS family arabinose efflux permease